jgi:DNA-binding protein HU-beta
VADARNGSAASVLIFDGWRLRAAFTGGPYIESVVENQRRSMASQRLTQTQLVRNLAESCEVNNKVARQFLDSLSSVAIAEVKKNGVFVLPGIGRLVRQDRKARVGRNPATGETIKIPAKKVVKFRVAKAAKDAIVPPKKKVG